MLANVIREISVCAWQCWYCEGSGKSGGASSNGSGGNSEAPITRSAYLCIMIIGM